MSSIGFRILVGAIVGALLVLCCHPLTRSLYESAWNASIPPVRSAAKLEDEIDLQTATLWAERAVLVPAHNRDEALLRLENAQSSQAMEPENAFWALLRSRLQGDLGNEQESSIARLEAKLLRDYDDHRSLALAAHLKEAGAQNEAWRNLVLAASWPFDPLHVDSGGLFSVVAGATIPGILLLVATCWAMVAGLAHLIMKYGRASKVAGTYWVYAIAFVSAIVTYLISRNILGSLAVAILIGAFGLPGDRVIHRNRSSDAATWAYFVVAFSLTCFWVGFLILGSHVAEAIDQTLPSPGRIYDMNRLVIGISFCTCIFVALSHVVSFVERREPTFEVLSQTLRVGIVLSLCCGLLAVLLAPLCLGSHRAIFKQVHVWESKSSVKPL